MHVQIFAIFLLAFICYGVGGACCNPNSNPANMQLCGLLPHAIPSPAKLNHEDAMFCPWAAASGPPRYQYVLTTARAVTPPCHPAWTGRWAQEGVRRGMLTPVGSVEPQNTSPSTSSTSLNSADGFKGLLWTCQNCPTWKGLPQCTLTS